jgi:hypothetical protein
MYPFLPGNVQQDVTGFTSLPPLKGLQFKMSRFSNILFSRRFVGNIKLLPVFHPKTVAIFALVGIQKKLFILL